MEDLFIYLYPLVTINSILAYLPQWMTLYKADDLESFSISSWVMWIVGSAISLGYGVFHLQDMMFCITTGVGLLFMIGIVSTVLYKRRQVSCSLVDAMEVY